MELLNGYTIAIRASGTEPKIKFYLSIRRKIFHEPLTLIKLSAEKFLINLQQCVINYITKQFII